MKIEPSSNTPKKPVRVEGAEGVEVRVLISKHDGANNFVMRLFELQPGGHTPLHIHLHEHEVFVVEGEGICVCQGKEYRIIREHIAFVPGGLEHTFRNTGDAVLKFLCLIPADAV